MNEQYRYIVDAIGEQSEVGARRPLVPDSGYIVTVSVDEVDKTNLNESLGTGGNPYVQLISAVDDGPFAGSEISARVPCSAGKDGKYVAYLRHVCKSITGKDVNMDALGEYAFPSPGQGTSIEDSRLLFKQHFDSLDPENRLDFMVKFLRIAEWDGRKVVAIIGSEEREVGDPDVLTGEREKRYFNRYVGFYPLNDAKKGAGWVRKACWPRQEQVLKTTEAGG